jgi:alkanesulfonate monooxygenase SsuD/methylene tetrahydromethanopterin reductase-like flavin-dependent oxidoreductase (luciferase family)
VNSHPVRVGLKIRTMIHSIDVQREVWRIADESGFDHLWVSDHLQAEAPDPSRSILDGWTTLASMAEVTKRTRIGVNVTNNLIRHPGLLAKIAVTIDQISGGRLEFGIGTGWNEPESVMMGMPYPSPADRVEMLDEACTIIKSLWTKPRTDFLGRFYQITDAIAEPKPLQIPYPPIWIGGSGPKRTLRAVAKHADVWNGLGPRLPLAPEMAPDVTQVHRQTPPARLATVDELVESSRVLDEHCGALGRDPAAIRRSVQISYESPDQAFEIVADAFAKGFSEFLLGLFGKDPRADAATAARVLLPRIRANCR